MSSRDAERYTRQELESVLAEFGLDYEFTTRSKHEAIEFMANGKRCVFTFTGSADPRAAMNARSDLRRLITSAGVEKVLPPEKEHYSFEPKAEEPPPVEAAEPKPPLPPAEPQYETLNTNADYLVYQPKLLVPGKCIVLELDRDLMVEKGNLLVVALHRANTFTTFTREQFNALFRRVEVAPPDPVAAPTLAPDPRLETLEQDRARMEARIAELQAKIEELAKDPGPTTYNMPEASEDLPLQKKPRRSNIVIEGNPYRVGPRNIQGVTPQAGRVLATMAYVSDLKHKVDLEPSSCRDFLSPADYYQYTARVTGLLRLGLVERSLPLPGGHGWHAKVTPAGHRIVRKLKDWPWLFDGQPVPSWFK